MFPHPAIHLELARLRQQDALAEAERYRLAHAFDRPATPRASLLARLAAFVCSALRSHTPVRLIIGNCPGEAGA